MHQLQHLPMYAHCFRQTDKAHHISLPLYLQYLCSAVYDGTTLQFVILYGAKFSRSTIFADWSSQSFAEIIFGDGEASWPFVPIGVKIKWWAGSMAQCETVRRDEKLWGIVLRMCRDNKQKLPCWFSGAWLSLRGFPGPFTTYISLPSPP